MSFWGQPVSSDRLRQVHNRSQSFGPMQDNPKDRSCSVAPCSINRGYGNRLTSPWHIFPSCRCQFQKNSPINILQVKINLSADYLENQAVPIRHWGNPKVKTEVTEYSGHWHSGKSAINASRYFLNRYCDTVFSRGSQRGAGLGWGVLKEYFSFICYILLIHFIKNVSVLHLCSFFQ